MPTKRAAMTTTTPAVKTEVLPATMTREQALNEFRLRHIPEQPSAPVMPGSTISVVTQQKVGSSVYQEHGLSDLIVSDIIRTRDTAPLTIILKLQKMLNVQVIDRKELEKRFQG